MSGPTIFNTCSVNEWEDAGTTLAKALEKYLDLCLSLGAGSLEHNTYSKSLATRIDSALETFHTVLDHQVARATAALALTRNKIVSPIYHCPEEVLSKIFSHVVYTPLDSEDPVAMEDSIVEMYSSLHNLLGVCTMWRHVALSRGSFWSTVPIMTTDSSCLRFPQSSGLSLKRAGGADLHLAAIIAHWSKGLPSMNELTKYASQFRTVNITSSCYCVVSNLLDIFGDLGDSGRLSELSIQRERDEGPLDDHPQAYDYIISPNSPSRPAFDTLLQRLSVFRLRGAPMCCDHVTFSKQLVELELQGFVLGNDSDIAKLVTALSSATELRDLKFVSVTTFPNPGSSERPATNLKIALPKLKTLMIQDLYANTLDCLLSSITSRSHELILHLTEKTFRLTRPGESEPEDIGAYAEDLIQLFSCLTVTTLLLNGEEERDWMSPEELGKVLNSMPDLKTLRMNYWNFDDDMCEALSQRSKADRSSFPQIKNLHITSSRIWDEYSFESMVATLGALERMELGASVCPGLDLEGEDSEDWHSINGFEDLAMSLEDNVPNFELLGFSYDSREFQPSEWQLW